MSLRLTHVQENISPVSETVFIIGFMGTGKTAAGREAARLAGCFWCDLDDSLEHRIGMPISRFMKESGEEAFRDAESAQLAQIIREAKGRSTGTIVSCGGGVVLRGENRRIMRENGVVVLLSARPETVAHRIRNEAGKRPLLDGADTDIGLLTERISSMMEARAAAYTRAAHHTIRTDGMSAGDVALAVLDVCRISHDL